MTVLVTGASGLLGRAVVERLVIERAETVSHLGPPGTLDPGLPSPVWASITDPGAVNRICSTPSSVVHLAGPPSVAGSFRDPEGCYRVHVAGTQVLLDACRRAGVRRFVYISSAEIYGAAGRSPVAESATVEPQSPYARAKVAAETVVRKAAADGEVETVVLRPFSLYGAASPERSLVGHVLRAVAHQPEVSVKTLYQVRDYVHVDDFADAVWRALVDPAAVDGVFNVASGIGSSIAELVDLALAAAGRDIPVRATALDDRPRADDLDALVGDARLARDRLGWHPSIGLQEGLSRCLASLESASYPNR